MRKDKELYLDGTRYIIGQYNARNAVALLVKLSKIIGKPLGILTAQTERDTEETKKRLIGEAIEALTSRLESDETLSLIDQILKETSIIDGDTNRPIIFDIDFAGKLGHLFKLLKEILTFQYADFLGDLAAITPSMAASKRETGRIKAL